MSGEPTIEERIAALPIRQREQLYRHPASEQERWLVIHEQRVHAESQPRPRSVAPRPAPGERPHVRGLGHRGDVDGSYWPE